MRDKKLVLRLTLIVLLAGFLSACGSGKTSPPATTEPSPIPTPAEITYCDISTTNLCLISFGFEDSDNLVITFFVSDPNYRNLTLKVNRDDALTYECQPVEAFPNRIYCTGPRIELGEMIDLYAYNAGGKLLARGAFIVDLQQTLPSTATVTPTRIAGSPPVPTSTPESSYPSYPSYP